MARGAARTRRRRWGVAGVAAAVVAGLAVSGVLVAQRAEAADPVLTAAVARADVTRSVSATGALVDELTYSVAADGAATLVQRTGTGVGSSAGSATSSSSSSSAGSASTGAATAAATTVSVAVEPGGKVARGDAIARVEDASGDERDVDAPVAGHVRSVSAAPRAIAGELVTIGSGRVLAALTVSENQIAQVRVEQPVALALAGGTATATGVVDGVEQLPDDSSGVLRYTVLVRLDAIPSGARIGMSATGAITTARADDVVAVPAAAVEVRGEALQVRVQDAGSATRVVPVRIGLVGDASVEVVSGLRAGQRVVVGAAGEVAATTSRLGPPAAVTGAAPSAVPTGAAR